MITILNFAYYRKEDWDRFLASIDDRDKMPETWEEWHAKFLQAKINCVMAGARVADVVVDIDELIHYCKARGLKNDGEARAEFVQGGGRP